MTPKRDSYDVEDVSYSLLVGICWSSILFPRNQIQLQKFVSQTDLRCQSQTELSGIKHANQHITNFSALF